MCSAHESGCDLLYVMGYLGDAEQSTVDSWVLDTLRVILLVELIECPECRYIGTLKLGKPVNLFSQCMGCTLEEGFGQDARASMATELCDERMGIQ